MKEYSIIKPDKTLQNNLMAFGFMCGRGWLPLIYETLDKIQAIVDRDGLDIQVTEIKEKYGGLRIYLDSDTDEIFELTQIAEEQSYNICEECSKPGKLHNVKGWWMTRCEACLKKEGEDK
jgi:hypothetical protein